MVRDDKEAGAQIPPVKKKRWALGPRDCASGEDEEEEEDGK